MDWPLIHRNCNAEKIRGRRQLLDMCVQVTNPIPHKDGISRTTLWLRNMIGCRFGI